MPNQCQGSFAIFCASLVCHWTCLTYLIFLKSTGRSGRHISPDIYVYNWLRCFDFTAILLLTDPDSILSVVTSTLENTTQQLIILSLIDTFIFWVWLLAGCYDLLHISHLLFLLLLIFRMLPSWQYLLFPVLTDIAIPFHSCCCDHTNSFQAILAICNICISTFQAL